MNGRFGDILFDQVVTLVGVFVEQGLELRRWWDVWSSMAGGESLMCQKRQIEIDLLPKNSKAIFIAEAEKDAVYFRYAFTVTV